MYSLIKGLGQSFSAVPAVSWQKAGVGAIANHPINCGLSENSWKNFLLDNVYPKMQNLG